MGSINEDFGSKKPKKLKYDEISIIPRFDEEVRLPSCAEFAKPLLLESEARLPLAAATATQLIWLVEIFLTGCCSVAVFPIIFMFDTAPEEFCISGIAGRTDGRGSGCGCDSTIKLAAVGKGVTLSSVIMLDVSDWWICRGSSELFAKSVLISWLLKSAATALNVSSSPMVGSKVAKRLW